VFEYHWHDVITYDVMLVLLSFIIAWGEAWFFDFRMIPLENKVEIVLCSYRPIYDLSSQKTKVDRVCWVQFSVAELERVPKLRIAAPAISCLSKT
jgi:hypothetical protein